MRLYPPIDDNSGVFTSEEIEVFPTSDIYELYHSYFANQQPKPKERKMAIKERYVELKDRTRKTRVVLCIVSDDQSRVFYGIALRSKEDENDIDLGRKLARTRAERAMKHRRPCWCLRPEAIENVWSLKFDDHQILMKLTGNRAGTFPKGGPIVMIKSIGEALKWLKS